MQLNRGRPSEVKVIRNSVRESRTKVFHTETQPFKLYILHGVFQDKNIKDLYHYISSLHVSHIYSSTALGEIRR